MPTPTPSRSTFRTGVIDPSWEPESSFTDEDVFVASRSVFRTSPIDPSWTPEDGFRRRDFFWRVPKIDFRRSYATVIEDWFGGDSEAALGRRYEKVEVLA